MRGRELRARALGARREILHVHGRDEETETDAGAAARGDLLDDPEAVHEGAGEDADLRALLDRRVEIDVRRRGRSAGAKGRRQDRAARGGKARRDLELLRLGLRLLRVLAPGERPLALGKDAARVLVLMNAAAAIFVGGKAENLQDAVKIATMSLESGKALEKLKSLIKKTTEEI